LVILVDSIFVWGNMNSNAARGKTFQFIEVIGCQRTTAEASGIRSLGNGSVSA
jgi:hypothetical protein